MADFGLAAQIGRGGGGGGMSQQQDPQNRMLQMMQLQQLQQNMMLAREQEGRAAGLYGTQLGTLQEQLNNLREQENRAVGLYGLQRGNLEKEGTVLDARGRLMGAQAGGAEIDLEEKQTAQRTYKGVLVVMDGIAKGTFNPADPAAFRDLPAPVRLSVQDQLAKSKTIADAAKKAGLEMGGVERAATYDLLDRAGEGITGPREYAIYRDKILKVEPNAADLLPRDYNPRNAQQLRDFVGDRKRVTEIVGGVPTVGLAGSPIRREVGVESFLPAGVQPPTRAQLGQFTPAEYGGTPAAPQMGLDPARMAAGTPSDVGAMQSGMPGQRLPVAGGPGFTPAAPPPRGPIPASQFLAERQAAPKPLTAPEERKLRNAIADDFKSVNATIDQMNGVVSAAKEVADLPEDTKKWISGWTGYLPSYQAETRTGDVALKNLKGKVTQLGRQAASLSGSIGSMAVQEWKIVSDMIANLDEKGMNPADLDRQLTLIEAQAQGTMNRIRDSYQRQYVEEFARFGDRFKLPETKAPSVAGGKDGVDMSNPFLKGQRQ